MGRSTVVAICLWFGVGVAVAGAARAEDALKRTATVQAEAEALAQKPAVAPGSSKVIQRGGRKQKGTASFYSRYFAGKKMANGKPFHPNSNTAASKTLPLGTTAKVTNVENGRSQTVTVEDRGPYVGDRILDVSPQTAEQLGMKKQGLAPVVVAPIAVPQLDGSIKAGAGAADSERTEPSAAQRPEANHD
jgi:rare lipoprotein A